MTITETTTNLTDDQLERLRAAAAGLDETGIRSTLTVLGLDSSRGLEGVPPDRVISVCDALRVAFRTDLRPPVAAHLGPLGGNERVAALSEARNQGWRAFDAAREAFDGGAAPVEG